MAVCQNCGRNISVHETTYRREIYSGSSQRVSYGKNITFGNSKYYSIKNVCSFCAQEIDSARKKQKNTTLFILCLIVLLGLLYFALKQN